MPPPPSPVDPPQTESVDDYVKAIYELSPMTKMARTSEIAGRLHVAMASVTGMAHRLAERGLLDHLPYHGVRLTPSGERLALRVLWRHRVIKMYLMRLLHCPWAVAEAEAEHLEHAVSDELVNRMAATLADPAIVPQRCSGLSHAVAPPDAV